MHAVVTLLLLCSTLAPLHEQLARKLATVDAAILEHPDDAALYLTRGEFHRLAGSWTAAWADYEQAVALGATPAVVERCRARQWLDMGDATRALGIVDELLAATPGRVLPGTLGGTPGARPDGEAEPPAHPEVGPLWQLKAEALDALERPCEAGPAWRRAVEGLARPEPDDLDAAITAFIACGDRQGALATARSGLDRLGACQVLELRALQLECDLGRVADALERVDRLAAGSARPERWFLRRGEVLEQSGQPERACAEYRRAHEELLHLPRFVRERGATQALDQSIRDGLNRLAAFEDCGTDLRTGPTARR